MLFVIIIAAFIFSAAGFGRVVSVVVTDRVLYSFLLSVLFQLHQPQVNWREDWFLA